MVQIDEDIIVRCQRGEKTAFRGVVLTYQRMVFSLTLKLLCDEEEAKDMVQETFIRVWQRMGEYDTQKNFATWIYTIATRLCLDRLKRMKHVVPMPDDELVFRRYASDTEGIGKQRVGVDCENAGRWVGGEATDGFHALSSGRTLLIRSGRNNRLGCQTGEEQPVCGTANHTRTIKTIRI